MPGIDLKTDGGYVVAPPSLHATGRRYSWADFSSPEDTASVERMQQITRLLQSGVDMDPAAREQLSLEASELLRTLTDKEAPIYVTVVQRNNQIMVRTGDEEAMDMRSGNLFLRLPNALSLLMSVVFCDRMVETSWSRRPGSRRRFGRPYSFSRRAEIFFIFKTLFIEFRRIL